MDRLVAAPAANHPLAIGDPVLPTLTNINGGTHGGCDAVLRRTATGEPEFANPMVPDWPEADFIVGNPPFIGGKDIRAKLGGDYAEALWKANPRVPKSADFVMQWWDHAAHILTAKNSPLRRFGFVTTNSITQTFSRRVIEGYLSKSSPSLLGEGDRPQDGGGAASVAGALASAAPPSSTFAKATADATSPSKLREDKDGLSLILAIPDHPWTKATTDAAAVRIAMTVAEAGAHDGKLLKIVREEGLETDDPNLTERYAEGTVNADLTIGADVVNSQALSANDGIASPGVKLHGAGFIVTASEATHLGLGKRDDLEKHIRPYRHGRDLLQKSRELMVIDLFGLDEKQVRQCFPEVYQHLLTTVKPERDGNRRESYKRLWWVHGEPRKDLRPALAGLPRFIATVETARHRIFQFVDSAVLPDNKIIVLSLSDAADLAILCSEIHQQRTFANCGLIGMANLMPVMFM